MASNAAETVAAIDTAAVAISAIGPRYASPEQSSRWKSFWSGLWCFGSQKRGKRIVPASRLDGGAGSSRGWPSNGPAQGVLAIAPPSSPVSFVNSSVQSPVSFNLSLSTASANMSSPGFRGTMFTIGPYAHETQLVSPPVFSTFTTEPSTAPFTPPPELAHLTTPSSPDVPFAQLLASSLEAKTSVRDTVSPFSASPLMSPRDATAVDPQATYFLYPGSPVGRLVSPNSGISGSGTSSPVPDIEFSSGLNSSVSSFPKFEPFSYVSKGQSPSAALILPEHMKPDFQHNLLLSETNGQELRVGCLVNVKRDVDRKGENEAIDAHNCQTAGKAVNESNEELQGFLIRGNETLDGSSWNGHCQTNWQTYANGRKECLERSWKKEEFCYSVAEAAFAKRKNISMERWLQRVEETQKCGMDVIARSRNAKKNVPQLPEGHGDTLVIECLSDRSVQGEFCSTSFEETGQMPTSDTTCATIDLDCQKGKPDELGNCLKYCVHSVEANSCRRCGELAIKCNELSAALEQAKERLASYERRGKAAESPDRNQKNLLKWMQLGVKLQQGNILRLSEKHSLPSCEF